MRRGTLLSSSMFLARRPSGRHLEVTTSHSLLEIRLISVTHKVTRCNNLVDTGAGISAHSPTCLTTPICPCDSSLLGAQLLMILASADVLMAFSAGRFRLATHRRWLPITTRYTRWRENETTILWANSPFRSSSQWIVDKLLLSSSISNPLIGSS